MWEQDDLLLRFSDPSYLRVSKGVKNLIAVWSAVYPVLEKDNSSQRALEIFSVSYFSPVGLPPEEPPPELLRDVLRSLALE